MPLPTNRTTANTAVDHYLDHNEAHDILNRVATLDPATGKVLTSQMPAITVGDTFTAASEAAMLALPASNGDLALRTDFTPNQLYVLISDSPGTLADWVQVVLPAPVSSVNGHVGAVTTPVFNAASAVYGLTRDQVQINAAVAAAVAAGGGKVFVPREEGPWTISRKNPASQSGGGIAAAPGVSIVSDGAELVLADNCDFISAVSAFGTALTITADVAAGAKTVTVGSSTGIATGDEIFVRLGDNPYDSAEPLQWFFATVTATTGTSVSFDRPVEKAVTVAGSTAGNRSISKVTGTLLENIEIGGFYLNNPQTGSANSESGVVVRYARNVWVRDITAKNPGAGVVFLQFAENCTVDRPRVTTCSQQNGSLSKGRGLAFAEVNNVQVNAAHIERFQGNAVSAEGYCRGLKINGLQLVDTYPGRSASYAYLLAFQDSDLAVDNLEVKGNGGAPLVDYGGTVNPDPDIYNMRLVTAAPITGFGPMSSLSGRITIGALTLPSQIKTFSQAFRLTPNMSNPTIPVPSGIIRSGRLYVTSKTGILGMYLTDLATGGTTDLNVQAVAGQTVNLVAYYGTAYPWNVPGAKALQIFTDGTVPAGSYAVLELEFWPSTGNDGTKAMNQSHLDVLPLLNPVSAIASPTTDVASLKAAVDAIRAALISVGITT